jgi:hypothetical protein
MAKLSVSLKPITKQISTAEEELRAIRERVGRANQKKFKLTIRALDKARRSVKSVCKAHYVVFPTLK